MVRTDIAALELGQLETALEDLGAKAFHARQIYRWVYRVGLTDFRDMTDLSVALREQLSQECEIRTPQVAQRNSSVDGTEKFLLELDDGRMIESVFIPDTPRLTFCVSTQVGCAMKCAFCLTGKMGLHRNLTAAEIAGQVRVLAHAVGLADKSFNVVLMGMGEPLHNYDATMKALRMLTARAGLAIPERRITLSTVGVPRGLERLAAEPVMPNLAVSLHAANDDLREQLVPVNRRYGLTDILEACRLFPAGRRRRITFEYVLLADTNDSENDARQLAGMLGGVKNKTKVNVIPLNEAPGIPFRRPTDSRINRFARSLARGGVTVSIRKSRGRDIRAACGQLLVEGAAGRLRKEHPSSVDPR